MNAEACTEALRSVFPTYNLTLTRSQKWPRGLEITLTVQNAQGSGETKCPEALDHPEYTNEVHQRGEMGGNYVVLQTLHMRGEESVWIHFACIDTEIIFRKARTTETYKGGRPGDKWSAKRPP